jgi:putative phosphoesterase
MMEPMELPGRRFALVADTHDVHCDWKAALAELSEAWGEVDAILHCGDLTSPAAIDTLALIAPVYATRNELDPPASPPVLVDGARLFQAGSLVLGMVFSLGEEGPSPDTGSRVFGRPVDVCIFGATHAPKIASTGGTLFVNPGSPTLAQRRSTAVLEVDGGIASVDLRLL